MNTLLTQQPDDGAFNGGPATQDQPAPEDAGRSTSAQQAAPATAGTPAAANNGDAPPAASEPTTHFPRAEYLKRRLADAERLLGHAADVGVTIDDQVRDRVLAARIAEESGHWTPKIAQDLLNALTALTAKLRPVTGESLRLCADSCEASRTSRFYKRVALCLAAIIVPFSLATFVTSGISKSVRADLTRANELGVVLINELRPATPTAGVATAAAGAAPASAASEALPSGTSQKDVIEHLQEFAALTRALYSNSKHLNYFVFGAISVPPETDLELDPKLADFYESAAERVRVYQGVRFFAQAVDSVVAIFYGAFAACVLPVLYALLGACAYLLRRFEEQVRTQTLTDSDAHLARFLIAGIAGAVIGLFNNFNLSEGASVSPLALAFLVGYAADVFFTFLEALIQSFNRNRNAGGSQQVQGSGGSGGGGSS